MAIKLYGHRFSFYTHLVALIAKEVGIDYVLITVDLRNREQKTPEYMACQPFGQIPYIDDDGFILYESRAIARYLAAKAKSPLLPTELKAAAIFEQAASVETSAFLVPVWRILLERYVKKAIHKQESNEEIVNEAVVLLSKNLDVYDVILSKTKYVAGDEITLVDFFHIPTGDMLGKFDVDVLNDPSRPNVLRWWNEISRRPSWLDVLEEFL